MREHSFRGKAVDTGRWIYGDLTRQPMRYEDPREAGDEKTGEIPVIIDSNGNRYAVDKRTVGELTGCKDKNGFPIYEGDILRHRISNAPFGVVKWNEDGYFCIVEGAKNLEPVRYSEERRTLGSMLRISISGTPVDFEVIGNIFDNAEQLKN